MAIEIEINDSSSAAARYITYAPSPCRIRQTGATQDLAVSLSSRPAAPGGGQAMLFADPSTKSRLRLDLTLPQDGSWVSFHLGGRFGFPSIADGDCLLAVSTAAVEVMTLPLMVRVRKNANNLTREERDRFLEALSQMNNQGNGVYQEFRAIHVGGLADREAHRGPQFLPWHRAFLLDFERELQARDPSVSLPYWRFDQPAPNLFRSNFLGATVEAAPEDAESPVMFDPGHALSDWVTDNQTGILRSALFDTQRCSAPGSLADDFPLISQEDTLALGDDFSQFTIMEGSPHGAAHVSFLGPISSVPTAVKDPLFFLLHANVDRLWALWQWLNKRTDPTDTRVYVPQNVDGRRLDDTMWAWNGVITSPRPNFAPGGPMPPTATTTVPGGKPTVRSMIDYEGRHSSPSRIGTGYDDVPYELT